MGRLSLYTIGLSMAVAASFASSSALAQLVDNGDGTITDDSASLMWLQNADHLAAGRWPNSNSAVDNLVFAGHDDWRLPTIEELEALYAALSSSGTFTPAPFVNLTVDSYSDWFWSSTETVGITVEDYFYFDFELGVRNTRTNIYQGFYSLPVRTLPVVCEVVDNGDGTVTDLNTGLMWLQDADTIAQGYWSYSNDQIAALTTGGHTDWRMPEIDELSQLYANLSTSGQFVPQPFVNLDVNGYSDWFWSNTPIPAGGDYYYFDFELGIQNIRSNVYQALYTLPVRTGGAAGPGCGG